MTKPVLSPESFVPNEGTPLLNSVMGRLRALNQSENQCDLNGGKKEKVSEAIQGAAHQAGQGAVYQRPGGNDRNKTFVCDSKSPSFQKARSKAVSQGISLAQIALFHKSVRAWSPKTIYESDDKEEGEALRIVNDLTNAELDNELTLNNQRAESLDRSELIRNVLAGRLSGAISPCPNCNHRLKFEGGFVGFKCVNGRNCNYTTDLPPLKAWVSRPHAGADEAVSCPLNIQVVHNQKEKKYCVVAENLVSEHHPECQARIHAPTSELRRLISETNVMDGNDDFRLSRKAASKQLSCTEDQLHNMLKKRRVESNDLKSETVLFAFPFAEDFTSNNASSVVLDMVQTSDGCVRTIKTWNGLSSTEVAQPFTGGVPNANSYMPYELLMSEQTADDSKGDEDEDEGEEENKDDDDEGNYGPRKEGNGEEKDTDVPIVDIPGLKLGGKLIARAIVFGQVVKAMRLVGKSTFTIDGGHVKDRKKGEHKGHLLFLVGEDTVGKIMVVGFVYCFGETAANYKLLFDAVRIAGFELNRKGIVILSDRSQAAFSVMNRVLPNAYHRICREHLWRNIQAKSGRKHALSADVKLRFFECSTSSTLEMFTERMNRLCESLSGSLGDYIRKVEGSLWADYGLISRALPCDRRTSNNAESEFNRYRPARNKSTYMECISAVVGIASKVFNDLCSYRATYVEKPVAIHGAVPAASTFIHPQLMKNFLSLKSDVGNKYVAVPMDSSSSTYAVKTTGVQDSELRDAFTVSPRGCNCLAWQMNRRVPCVHGAAVYESLKDPGKRDTFFRIFFAHQCRLEKFDEAYSSGILVNAISSLSAAPIGNELLPPGAIAAPRKPGNQPVERRLQSKGDLPK